MGRQGGPGNGTGVTTHAARHGDRLMRAAESRFCKGHRKAANRIRPHWTDERRQTRLRMDQPQGSHIGRCTRAPTRERGDPAHPVIGRSPER